MNPKTLYLRRIQGKKHKHGTYKIKKISAFDDKRFALNDGIHTLAYFQKDLKKSQIRKILIKRKDSHR